MDYGQIQDWLEGDGPEEAFEASYSELEEYAEKVGKGDEYRDLIGDPEEQDDLTVSWEQLSEVLEEEEKSSGILGKIYSVVSKPIDYVADNMLKSFDVGVGATLGFFTAGPLGALGGAVAGYGIAWGTERWLVEEEEEYTVTVEP